MKITRIIALFAFTLGGFGLVPQAHADWWWYHHHHGPRVVVVAPGPIVVGRPYYGAPVVYPGRSIAIDVQAALQRQGYYRGYVDGAIGPASRAAIRAYQYDHRLPVSGDIDRPLVRSLGL